jgi:hypothetical protein
VTLKQKGSGVFDMNEGEDGKQGCPLCAFIEAGPCKSEHIAWVDCREKSKEQGQDFVAECQNYVSNLVSVI